MKVFYYITLILVLTSCSIQSTQYDTIRNILISNAESTPEPLWTVEWSGKSYNVFAVNDKNNIYFINEEIFLHFDGWELIKIEGLIDNKQVLLMSMMGDEFKYSLSDGSFTYSYICGEWLKSNVSTAFSRYTKKCNDGEISHNNYFDINNNNQMVNMSYKIFSGRGNINIYLGKNNSKYD